MNMFKQKHSPPATLKDLTETERGRRRGEEGTGGSCWASADGLTRFQGKTMEPKADFQKANCHSEQYGTCLVSSSPVWRVELGEETGMGRRGQHYGWAPVMGREWKWNSLNCIWNALKWKLGRLLWRPLDSIQTGPQLVLSRNEWASRRRSSESTQTMMPLPRWRTTDPDPQYDCRQTLYIQTQSTPPHPLRLTHPYRRPPILHIFLFLHLSDCGCTISCMSPLFLQCSNYQSCLHRLKRQPIWTGA